MEAIIAIGESAAKPDAKVIVKAPGGDGGESFHGCLDRRNEGEHSILRSPDL